MSINGEKETDDNEHEHKPLRFWLIMLAISITTFVAAFDAYGFSTALPIIAQSLGANSPVWLLSAQQITSLAFIPLAGNVADRFGRRNAVLAFLFPFIIGCLVTAVSDSFAVVVFGRALQGMGIAGAFSLPTIIVSDITTLAERGRYSVIIQAMWALGGVASPLVFGAFAETNWHAIFWLAFGIGCAAFVIVALCMNVKTPPQSPGTAIRRIDWIGNALFVASSVSVVFAFVWGGNAYAWSSWRVLLPLLLGILGYALFIVYEHRCTHPLAPPAIFGNRTAVLAYVCTLMQTLLWAMLVIYLPYYYQAVRLEGALESGLSIFPMMIVAEVIGILTGFYIAWRKEYKAVIALCWPFMLAGNLAMSFLGRTTPTYGAILAQICTGIGAGILADSFVFPLLASVSEKHVAAACAFAASCRALAMVLSVFGTTILQNQLALTAPASYLATLPRASDGRVLVDYGSIAQVATLPLAERVEVQDAYAKSIRVIWWLNVGLAVAGFVASLAVKVLPLRDESNNKFGMEEIEPELEIEAAQEKRCTT